MLKNLPRFARAFQNRNYRIYTAGNTINLIGFWMQRIAVGWLTWELTQSEAWLGVIAFADLFPTVIISPFSGAIADRYDRLAIAKTTQCLILLQAVTLACLTLSGLISIWLLLSLTLWQGIVSSFWQPVRLALIPSLVAEQDLASAVAVNSVIFNSARFIGPAVAGLVIVISGPGWAFAGNALTSIALLLAIFRLRLAKPALPAKQQQQFLAAIAEGYRYASRHPGIRLALLVLLLSCISLRPVFELLPGFAAEVFARGADGLAALAAMTGIGSVIAGFVLGQRATTRGLATLVINHLVLLAGSLFVFSLTDNYYIALFCIAIAGFATVIGGASIQTLLQTSVASNVRGRIMALYGMIVRGGPAVGALLMGALSESFGLQIPLMAGCCIILLLWWWLKRQQENPIDTLENR